MLFNSTVFILFFAAFFAAYWSLSGRPKTQNLLVLGGSLLFYGWWDERFLILIGLSTAIDYLAAIGASGDKIERDDRRKSALFLIGVALAATLPTFAESWKWFAAVCAAVILGGMALPLLENHRGDRRRAWVITSVAANLGLLATFKYFGFFAETFVEAANEIGFHVNAPMMKIVLPIGISFYTFQTLSYTIDAFRGELRASRSLLNFAAYVTFFPQLVAGPIERARSLLPQFETRRRWDGARAFDGGLLFLWGLYKKTAIADNLGPIVTAAFADPAHTAPDMMLLGVLAFSVQIYCDFSGYSDMARGLAKMLGFELMLNFDLPYFSRTPSEFWRRWHISLSSWLRDYLYVPLGGNRFGKLKTYRNLLLTMLLGGLWHGAAWTFIAWGAFHGGILAIYRAAGVDRLLERTNTVTARGLAAHVSAWLVMSMLTLVGWTFFRAQSLPGAFAALHKISSPQSILSLGANPEAAFVFSICAPLIIANLANRFMPNTIRSAVAHSRNAGFLPFMMRANAALVLLCAVTFLAAEGQQDFIYFDF